MQGGATGSRSLRTCLELLTFWPLLICLPCALTGLPGCCGWREVCGLVAEFGLLASPRTLAAMLAAVARTAPAEATRGPMLQPAQLQAVQQQQQQQQVMGQPLQAGRGAGQPQLGAWLRSSLFSGDTSSQGYRSISSFDEEEDAELSSSSSSSSGGSSSENGRLLGVGAPGGGSSWVGQAGQGWQQRPPRSPSAGHEPERCRSVLLKVSICALLCVCMCVHMCEHACM